MSSTAAASSRRPRIKTPPPGPRAAASIARDAQALSPSFTRPYPLVIEHGEGLWVIDVDGNEFLDFTAGIAVTTTGHSHPFVVAAIEAQARRFLHMSGTDFYYEQEIRLAERLSVLAPVQPPARVFFTNSGAEAIEGALKLARWSTRRPNCLAFTGAFHGRTLGALSLTGSKAIQRDGFAPLLPGVFHVPFPSSHGVGISTDEVFRRIEETFQTVAKPESFAAVFVEPIQGEGGYLVPHHDFLPRLRELTRQHGILLVADEVQTGMGRTGRLFALEHSRVEADIVTLAKGIASGLPLGALIAGKGIMTWPPGSHGSTFGGNPVSCAAALATLDLLEGGLIENAAVQGRTLRDGLEQLHRRYPDMLTDARGKGLMMALECASGERAHRLMQAAFQRGLLVLPTGTRAIRLSPALMVSAHETAVALEILDDSCAELSRST
ncbi:MAG: acetyl ornithine aminotransferase family protein [Planctomycetes bacterium]|nr:acetyl ornithine aminotransferase family protein [Planctomycetota bacterium]